MPKNKHDQLNFDSKILFRSYEKFRPNVLIIVFIVVSCFSHFSQSQLPSKIFNIQKSFEEVPIINLADLSADLEPITLLIDTGSSQLAIFDDQCYECQHTFSVCRHVKISSNETFLSYLLTQFKGEYSYLTLGKSIRLRFFCVLEIQGNQNGLQANGVLGIQLSKMNLLQKALKESNGIKIWKKIIEKIYQTQLKALKENPSPESVNKLSTLRLKYSILYSPYHTQLILGDIPETYSKNSIGQLILTQQIFSDSFNYFADPNQIANSPQIIQQTVVHFDSGSSVIVLPWPQFNNLFQQVNIKSDNQCKIQNSQIQCLKNSLINLIQESFSFNISIYQKSESQKINQLNLSISLQNLIQKSHQKNDNCWFQLKFIGHNKTSENAKDFIILGIPFFKQYLIQFDIPIDTDQKRPLSNLINTLKSNDEYRINMYDLHARQNGQLLSPYEHLIKKYEKNVKLFTFFYIFFVFLFTYLFINIFWWINDFIKGKRLFV